MEFWTRSATVQVGDKTYSMSDFDFDFDVQFEDSKEPTTAVVTIYNLAETTRNSMKKGDPVILNAGYEGDIGVIFVGQIAGIKHSHSSTEWATKITASEALEEWLTAQVNKCYDQSPEAAVTTTQQVIQMIRGYKPEYPIFYDVEYEPYNTGEDDSGRSKAQVRQDNTDMICAALNTLEDAGYYAVVYCSRAFFTEYTNLDQLEAFDKWEAAYTATDTDTVKNGIWQYSSKNPLGIPGFGDSLDCDVAYKDYPAISKKAGLNGWG